MGDLIARHAGYYYTALIGIMAGCMQWQQEFIRRGEAKGRAWMSESHCSVSLHVDSPLFTLDDLVIIQSYLLSLPPAGHCSWLERVFMTLLPA